MARSDRKRSDEPDDIPGRELVATTRSAEQLLTKQLVAKAREEGIDLVGPASAVASEIATADQSSGNTRAKGFSDISSSLMSHRMETKNKTTKVSV